MKIRRQISTLFFIACLTLIMAATAYARQVPDLYRTGSVSVTMKADGKTVPGGELMFYQVGRVQEDDGDYRFVLTEDFEKSRVSLDDPESAALAGTLSEYVSGQGLDGTKSVIGNDGRAVLSGLKPGLYLVVQTKAADGYEAISPFLVSVPINENGSLVYDVDATPKMELLTEKEPTKSHDLGRDPGTDPNPSEPTAPLQSRLPQTGQLNWPVPVLAALGIGFLLLGMHLRAGDKAWSSQREENKKDTAI